MQRIKEIFLFRKKKKSENSQMCRGNNEEFGGAGFWHFVLRWLFLMGAGVQKGRELYSRRAALPYTKNKKNQTKTHVWGLSLKACLLNKGQYTTREPSGRTCPYILLSPATPLRLRDFWL